MSLVLDRGLSDLSLSKRAQLQDSLLLLAALDPPGDNRLGSDSLQVRKYGRRDAERKNSVTTSSISKTCRWDSTS